MLLYLGDYMKINLLDIPGVGEKTQKKLNQLGLYSIEDLISYFPYRFEDRSRIVKILELIENEKQLIRVSIRQDKINNQSTYKKNVLQTEIYDDTGMMYAIWFNQPYIRNKINESHEVFLFGKIQRYNNRLYIINPEILNPNNQDLDFGYSPIYKLSKGIKNNEIKRVILSFFKHFDQDIENILPKYIITKYNLLNRREAFKWLHFPPTEGHYQKSKISLAFEELFILFFGLSALKRERKELKGILFNLGNAIEDFFSLVPFELTKAQIKVIEEIAKDMNSEAIMNRMIQGDVGSGKTIVAFFAIFLCWRNGLQAAMLAPTEILVRQHFETFKALFSDAGIRFELLLGSQTSKEKIEIKRRIEEGEIDFIIGTHSLIQENVIFKHLGLVITDEQHRFGVKQRALLAEKGKNPDVLVMSATPIPRTLSLIVYGDLDLSVIDELPPGRQSIITRLIHRSKYQKMLNFIEKHVTEGRQIYFVAPAIYDSELEMESVENVFSKLNKRFQSFNIKMIHGRQTKEEKESIFKDFLKQKIQILIATTVIEVGVNVPNASIMVIEGAERFGLSQLHQLRGRVGRGIHQSYCFLVTTSDHHQTTSRLKVLCESNDGFFIANEDLKLRGPGEFLGTRQHGMAEIKTIQPYRYEKMIEVIKKEIEYLWTHDTVLTDDEQEKLDNKVNEFYKKKKIVLN